MKEVNFEEEPLPFADDAVDVVVFNEVFEHLRVNPIFTFREINRVLRPQGTLLPKLERDYLPGVERITAALRRTLAND